MYAYQQAAPVQNRSSVDVTAWALVALVVALLCGTVGWFVASHGVLSRGDLQNQTDLVAREGAARGVSVGYNSGAATGRKQAALRARLNLAETKRSATQDGYNSGFSAGRQRAEQRAGDSSSIFGLDTSDAFPPDNDLDALSGDLFSDTPGYASSAYGELGYGTDTGSAYDSTSPLSPVPLG